MKRLTIITAMMLASPAFAQTPGYVQAGTGDPSKGPTVEQVQEQANDLITALRNQLIAANDQIVRANAANAKLTRDLEAAKKVEPKKDEK